MATILERPLRREISVGKDSYIVTLSPATLKLTVKGRRNGLEIAWKDIVNGEAALAAALNASLESSLTTLRGSKAKSASETNEGSRGKKKRAKSLR
jgi:hypothetical protein